MKRFLPGSDTDGFLRLQRRDQAQTGENQTENDRRHPGSVYVRKTAKAFYLGVCVTFPEHLS